MSDLTKILVVEDEAIVAMDIRQRLEKMGFEVSATVATGRAALDQVQQTPPNLILMDIQIKGDWDGIETAAEIKKTYDGPVVFLTANSDRATVERAKAGSPLAYLLKPFEDRELQTTIEIALERNKLERQLKASEQWLRTTLQSIGDAVLVTDTDGCVTLLNSVAERLIGISREKAVGKSVGEVLILADQQGNKLDNPVNLALKSGKTVFLDDDTYLLRSDGTKITVDDSAAPITDDKGRVTGVVLIFRDVSDRRESLRRLHESEKRYDLLFNSVQEGIAYVDANERVTFCNPAFSEIFDEPAPDSMVGKSIFDYLPEEMRARATKRSNVSRFRERAQLELDITSAEGTAKTIMVSMSPVFNEEKEYLGAVGGVLDVTARRQMEKTLHEHGEKLELLVRQRTHELQATNASLLQEIDERRRLERQREEMQDRLHKAEKMESLGLLAGGVAHDLNNTLGPLVGYPELILRKMPDTDPMRKMVERIGRAAQDAASVIQDLLTLARRGRYEMRPTLLNLVILDFLDSAGFLRVKAEKPNIAIHLDLADSMTSINGSSAHLSKVIGNLIFNAFDAMGDQGELTISTRYGEYTHLSSGFEEIAPGNYCVVSVKDTGHGIAPEDIAKIFEPYFSKKKMGRSGTGLGLAVVYGVIKDHGGYYDVVSTVGKGTEFLLYFPAMEVGCETSEQSKSLERGTERVLVVDDSEDQRELASHMLADLGYRVSTAVNGTQAVQMLREQEIDLVLLDMIMEPNFDGLDTYREILKMRMNQITIIASGYSSTERVEEALRLGASAFLKKPYTLMMLATYVRTALRSGTRQDVTTNFGGAAGL